VSDLVRIKKGHLTNWLSEGQMGVIIEISKVLAKVYWYSGKVYWIETSILEVVDNEAQ